MELERVELTPDRGPVLHIKGADLMDGTPIFDIKPYITYADSHPDATGGFTAKTEFHALKVALHDSLCGDMDENTKTALVQVLSNDPRPQYHDDPERVYGFGFAGFEVKFKVDGDKLTVLDIKKEDA